MRKLRYFMRGCFGLIAALQVVRAGTAFNRANFEILALAVLCGIAWWTLKRGKASGRRWAIASSVVLLLSGLMQGIFVIISRFWHLDPELPLGLLTFIAIYSGFQLAWGIAGLIAFWPKDAVEQMSKSPAAPRDFQKRPKFKQFVCWGFAGFSVFFALLVPTVNPFHHSGPNRWGILGLMLEKLGSSLPLALAISCGIACWTVRTLRASGRTWVMIASAIMLLPCMVIGLAEIKRQPVPHQLVALQLVLLASAVAGLLAFAPRDAMAQMPAQSMKTDAAGDPSVIPLR